MPPDPHDRPSGGLDPESEKWWRELAGLDDDGPDRDPLRAAPQRGLDRELSRSRRARRRSARRHDRRERGGSRVARSLLTFAAVMLTAAGAITVVERGWEQTREASFNEGGHLDGTTIQGTQGTYAFLQTHPGTKHPVTYGPCRTVRVEINPTGEVPGGSQIVLEAMARISELSGVELVYAGPTDVRPDVWSRSMTSGGLEAYPPALVSWSDEDETPGLAGDVVGLGGSISLRGGGYARQRYMTGSVTLDGPQLTEILEDSDDGEAQVRAVVLHEFGHLLGLGHVDDPDELMSASNQGQLEFGPGDKEGLSRLGSGEC